MTADPGRAIEPAYATSLPAPMGGALPTGLEWQALERMANTLAESDVIPYRLKRKPADVAVILLAAREYGIPPLMALSKLPVVNGTPAPMGELMVALVLRAGHKITAKTLNPDGTVYKSGPIGRDHYAVCMTLRAGEAPEDLDELTFTVAEAEAASLLSIEADGSIIARDSKGQPTPWELYPANMLRWRAVANACRLRFPDVLLGLSYLPEELGAVVDESGAPVIEAEPVRTAPPASLALRTAQETADRAADENRPEVLEHVREWSEANELLDVDVTVTDIDKVRRRATLGTYLLERIETAKAIPAATVVEGTVADAPPASSAAASAPPDASPASQAAPDAGAPSKQDTELAEAYVYDALRTADPEVVRGLYRDAKAGGDTLLNTLVDAYLTAPVEAALKLSGPVKLGGLLMAVGAYLNASPGAPLVVEGPPEDPPASPPAEGWPDQPQQHPDELPVG